MIEHDCLRNVNELETSCNVKLFQTGLVHTSILIQMNDGVFEGDDFTELWISVSQSVVKPPLKMHHPVDKTHMRIKGHGSSSGHAHLGIRQGLRQSRNGISRKEKVRTQHDTNLLFRVLQK